MKEYLRFRAKFAEALDQRLFTIEYLDWLIVEGRAKFWTSGTAAIVAEIKTYPTGAKAVSGLIATGDLTDIETILIPLAEQWGRENGCIFGMIESRTGWAKRMKPHGYEPFQVSLIKEL